MNGTGADHWSTDNGMLRKCLTFSLKKIDFLIWSRVFQFQGTTEASLESHFFKNRINKYCKTKIVVLLYKQKTKTFLTKRASETALQKQIFYTPDVAKTCCFCIYWFEINWSWKDRQFQTTCHNTEHNSCRVDFSLSLTNFVFSSNVLL